VPILLVAAAVLAALLVAFSLSRGKDSEAVRIVDAGTGSSTTGPATALTDPIAPT